MFYIVSNYVIGQTTRILEIFLKFEFTLDLIASMSLCCAAKSMKPQKLQHHLDTSIPH